MISQEHNEYISELDRLGSQKTKSDVIDNRIIITNLVYKQNLMGNYQCEMMKIIQELRNEINELKRHAAF